MSGMPVSTLGSSGMVNPGIKDGAIDGPRSALQEKIINIMTLV